MEATTTVIMDKKEIMKILPHRPPFLFVDEVLELEAGVGATAVWHITGDEYFFQGHFPGNAVLPGVLITEAIAQAGAVAILAIPRFEGKTPLFAAMNHVRFRRVVKPGDTLTLKTHMDRVSHGFGQGRGWAMIGDDLVCEMGMTFAIQG